MGESDAMREGQLVGAVEIGDHPLGRSRAVALAVRSLGTRTVTL